jgi:hypothetical protein
MNSVKSTTKLADAVIADTENIAYDYAEMDLTIYDGEVIRGSEVVNFIKKQLGDYAASETAPLYLEIITKASGNSSSRIYTNNKHIKDIKDFSSNEHYIKPTAMFMGKVIRNENKVIIGVNFAQN